jgi:chromosomal replication initiator protein
MNIAQKSASDSPTFGIPMTHLRNSVLDRSFLVGDEQECEIGSFVGGLHEFVGDGSNRLLKCLENNRFYQASIQSSATVTAKPNDENSELDDDDRFSETDVWPIVFYGESGTGKTSLALTVISNFIEQQKTQHQSSDGQPIDSKPVCMTGSDFFRRFRAAIETQSVDEFRRRIVESPGLVIDNVEQLESKTSSQQELVQILDNLSTLGRPVVITMNSSPQSNDGLIQKLVSRLSGGLCLPTFPPGKQARIELIEKLARIHQVTLTPEAANWVAEHLVVTVPKLNHFFIQLQTELKAIREKSNTATDRSTKLTLPTVPLLNEVDVFTLAKLFQRDDVDEEQLIKLILQSVASEFHLKPEQLKSKSRKQTIVLARGVAIYLQREMLGTSFLKIGTQFGNRDHSTIMHAYRKIQSVVDATEDSATKLSVEQLKTQLNEKFAQQLTVVY